MTQRKHFFFVFSLGIGATAVAAVQLFLPGSPLGQAPISLFWVSMAVLVSLIPVRRLMGTQGVNLSSLVMFSTLVLFGSGTAFMAGWLVGTASVVSSRSGNPRIDVQRAMLESGKYAMSIGGAGLVLWGTTVHGGALEAGLGSVLMLRLLPAYVVYLGIKGLIKSVLTGLRDNAHIWDLRHILTDWRSAWVWVVPPSAYLLALIYLNSQVLTITMLASILLVHALSTSEEQGSRSSWVRLTDGLRQACDGHVVKRGGETQRVVDIATAIGRKMNLPTRSLKLLRDAAALHNIGYIALDPRLVLKPGKLTPEDIAAIRQHPECGRKILSDVAGMEDVAEVVEHHHESPDGNGYPRGLKDGVIPVEAAVIKVAEAFVAMTSPRVYRGKMLTREQALEEIAAAAGTAFDPIAAYYLCEMSGRSDLVSGIAGRFGTPERSAVISCLSKCGPDRPSGGSGVGRSMRSVFAGLALLGAAFTVPVVFSRLGAARPLAEPSLWFTLDTQGALFLMVLLGFALVKPVRMAWGACTSWASAVVLALVLAGGPFYIPVSGMGLIGWMLLLKRNSPSGGDPSVRDEASGAASDTHDRGVSGGDSAGNGRLEILPLREHQRVLARIGRANRVRGHLGAVEYSMVLMLAGGCAWTACWLGHRIWSTNFIGLILSPVLLGFVGSGVFYLVETSLQAALLSAGGPSALRTWHRNYAGAFPEPLTYAIFGYGIALVSGLLGIWAAVLIFALPTMWRHNVLLSRTRTRKTTHDLVRSIARTVDLKNGNAAAHASSVAATATAVARQMGSGEAFVEELEIAAILHDLGKASWSNKALAQRAPWEQKEERSRHVHPDMSAEIAIWAGYPRPVAEMIRSHHEHYDGSGYTRGLKGAQIPLGGRILRTADSFASAIQAGDPRFARTLPEVVREMRFGSGKQFDPEVVRALIRVLECAVFSEPAAPRHTEPGGVTENVSVGV